jgi:hypothetical protein
MSLIFQVISWDSETLSHFILQKGWGGEEVRHIQKSIRDSWIRIQALFSIRMRKFNRFSNSEINSNVLGLNAVIFLSIHKVLPSSSGENIQLLKT